MTNTYSSKLRSKYSKSGRLLRSARAAVLLTVLIMSVVSMIFLLALGSIVTSAVRASASDKLVEGLRNSAEVGIDYAVDRFNSVYPCPLDPSSSGSLTTMLPATELQGAVVNGVVPNTGIPNVTVTIKVKRLAASDWAWLRDNCTVYSPQIDPNNSVSAGWQSPASTNITMASGGGFRVVESTATNGIISRTIRVILKARFNAQPDGTRPLETGGASPIQNNYFQQPLLGNASLELSGGEVFGIPDPNFDPLLDPSLTDQTHRSENGTVTYNLNVQSNSSASLKSLSLLTGDLTVASANSGTNTVLSMPTSTVAGRVTANGSIDSTVAPYSSNGNVQARADNPNGTYDPFATRSGDNATPIVLGSSSASQAPLSPIAAPSSATTLNDLSTYLGPGNSPTADGSTIFQTQSLSTDNVPAGQTVPFNNNSAPVQIFIDQGSSSANAVSIDTSKIATSSSNPADFQIWYEGNKPVKIDLTSNFKGLIYAPNAKVTITNSSGTPSFFGAAVGKNLAISLQSGKVGVATGIATNGYGGGGSSADPLTFKYNVRPGEGTVIQGWQPITWQEYGG